MQLDILKSVHLWAALSVLQPQSAQLAPQSKISSWISQLKHVSVILPTTLQLRLQVMLAFVVQDSI